MKNTSPENTYCGIFLFDINSNVLLVHPTNAAMFRWSIPQGILEPGESYVDAAEREMFEGTNLKISDYRSSLVAVAPLAHQSFDRQRKSIVPFYYELGLDLKSTALRCDSIVEARGYPEYDDFMWVSIAAARGLLPEAELKAFEEALTYRPVVIVPPVDGGTVEAARFFDNPVQGEEYEVPAFQDIDPLVPEVVIGG